MGKAKISSSAALAILLGLLAALGCAAQTVTIAQQGAIPLRLSDAAVTSSPEGFGEAACTLYNTSSQRLLAVALEWTFTFTNGHSVHGFQAKDYLYNLAAELGSGASDRLMAGEPQSRSTGSAVRSVTVEIAGAEFADGTVLGPDSARMVSWLSDARSSRARAFRSLLAIYRVRGEDGLKSAVNSSNLSDTLQMHAVKRTLSRLEDHQGMSAVVERVKRQAAVEAPPLK